ncbi:hypothetical protein [Natronobeatus ordinarius]|uniref:hypothetical protein n=1 Tax=Natronobeatus ordinarius TaxID=2963433 RepID=UPI0020CC04A7|nr:hypothetical protein [Natronobeatus ordinarius]
MFGGMIPASFIVLGVLIVLALRYEFELPLTLTVVLTVPALALGGVVASLLSVLFAVPVWYALVVMAVVWLLLAAWSEVRTPSRAPSV